MDTWYGPKFSPETLDDMSHVGLAVIGRSTPSPFDSSYPIERTEFFWKRNEAELVKTLEIEEVSRGEYPFDSSWHINRYVHTERDTERRTFRHLDGAAEVYTNADYGKRVGSNMPKNARPTYYSKLFRIDGTIDLEPFLLLTSMFYKGNEMVVEYFDEKQFDEKFRPIIERWQACQSDR